MSCRSATGQEAQARVPEVSILGTRWFPLLPMDRHELTEALAAMTRVALQGHECRSVELELVRDRAMAQCNAEHMGLPGPTNVLTFPSDSQDMPACLILSVDTLLREAQLYRQPPRTHLLRLLAHALAHAAGYDHSSEMDDFSDNMLKSIKK